MPLYAYGCRENPGHYAEEYRSIAERDQAPACEQCAALGQFEVRMVRRLTAPQRPVIHPLGWNLHPGDKGYWSFETPEGRVERPQVAPFAKAEDFYKHPPKPVPTDTPVLQEDYR